MTTALSSSAAVRILARATAVRMTRGWTVWLALVLAGLPMLAAVFFPDDPGLLDEAINTALPLLALLPPLLVAPPVADEIDDKTYTYLWSRPFPRWTIVAGKLLAALPVAAVATAAGAVGTLLLAGATPAQSATVGAAFVAGACASGIVAAAIATALSRHGLIMAIIYLVLDYAFGRFDAGFTHVTVSRNVEILAGAEPASSAVVAGIWLAALSAGFLALALWRQSAGEPAARQSR